jgi:hypothetical protein
MTATGFILYEYDDNEEVLVTFIFPEASQELKAVVQETAIVLVASNVFSFFSSYKEQYLYFESKVNPSKSGSLVRHFGICVLAPDVFPPLYSALGKTLLAIYADSVSGVKVLRGFLAALTEGSMSYQGEEYADDSIPKDFYRLASFDVLLDRAAQHIPIIWQALVTGKSVAVYSPDITVLRACAIPILALVPPGARQILPLVLESSPTQTVAADQVKHSIWFSLDASVLSNRFDLAVDLAGRNLKIAPQFSKEAGKSGLLNQLANAIAAATSHDGNIVDVLTSFNEQIISLLKQVKEKFGNLSPQSIASLPKLPSDTKFILASIANSGVFNL